MDSEIKRAYYLEQLIKRQHNGLIWSIVRRYLGRGVEADDLYQLASIGFLKAVRGFDPQYGTQFSTYAVPKIAGEIRRFLRDDRPVKIRRTLQEQSIRLLQLQNNMEHKLGRYITISELAEQAGLSSEEAAMAIQAIQPIQSLEESSNTEGLPLLARLSGKDIEEDITTHLSLQQAIDRLPARLAQIITMRYRRDMTQQQIARVLGVSQVQISRLEHRALTLLRQDLEF